MIGSHGRQPLRGGVLRSEGGGVLFFFQAEDGIRDLTVTGVQTCALPISLMPTSQSASERHLAASASGNSSLSARRLLKPSRIDCGVIDCSQRRSIGFLMRACWTM